MKTLKMNDESYSLDLPDNRDTSVVFASPHSGRSYPDSFLGQSILDKIDIRSSEDAFVDNLFHSAPLHGAPFLKAKAPRAFLDLNRSATELDPALIEGAPKQRHNPRVASGLGVIPRVVSGGRVIYRGKMSMSEANKRIGRYWRPYHDRLQRLLDESQYFFGQAILIDCHSMPSEAISGIARAGGKVPDIVLGDRFGAAASPDIVDRVEATFKAQGFKISRNAPFAGAFITQHYGRPSRNQHVIQVEINRALYMNEVTVEPLPAFGEFEGAIARTIRSLTAIGRREDRLAAE